MNIYHRYIELPFTMPKPDEFNQPGKDFISYVGQDAATPELKEWLATHNLKLSNVIEGFYTSPKGGEVPIHNDMPVKPYERDATKLNFTWGPSESVTRWWKIKDPNNYIEINHDANTINAGFEAAGIEPDIDCYKCYSARDYQCDMVYERVIDKPSILNVGQLHSTYNPDPDNDRWTLSFTLLKLDGSHLKFDEAIEKFNNIIHE